MKTIQSTFLILALMLPFSGFSQTEFLDFGITKKNDTVYGSIRNGFSNKKVLFEKQPNPRKGRIKFRSHKLKKYRKIRFNDDIYTYVQPSLEDGIYAKKRKRIIPEDSVAKELGDFVNIQKRLPDFVITDTDDTVYGRIEDPVFGKLRLLDSSDVKIKIREKHIKAFRFNNEFFEHKEKSRVIFHDKKDAYLKLLLDGKVKLYEYEYTETLPNLNSGPGRNLKKYYYIEKDNDLVLIKNLFHKKKLAEMFSDDQNLVSKIRNEEYTTDNIYLIVKYYNENN